MNAESLFTILLSLLAVFIVQSDAFSASHNNNNNNNKVTVTPVTTPSDVMALADLRYDEWMVAPFHRNHDDDNNIDEHIPSRYAFRIATAEVVEERSRAMAFLARMEDEKDDHATTSVVVGAAELSPIEFEEAIDPTMSHLHQNKLLYVTDVVTSSKFRRQGIAHTLMDTLEQSAYDQFGNGTCLFLHVKSDNEAAKQFYATDRRGYKVPTKDQLDGIRVDCLEENAGTTGQILLCKTLVSRKRTVTRTMTTRQKKSRVATGFGNKSKTPVSKKSKKK